MIVDRIALKKRLDRATARLETPIAVVDLAALDDNAADLVRRAARQADPGGQQVGALPDAARAGAGPPGLARRAWRTRCPRRSGWGGET